jgi:hypothetical protein
MDVCDFVPIFRAEDEVFNPQYLFYTRQLIRLTYGYANLYNHDKH